MNTTTRVRGFHLTRRDGQEFAFTDCDVDLVVAGVTYEASAALSPSEASASVGMAVDEQEVQGGLRSDRISESDLASGLYDGAGVRVVEIDWRTRQIVDVVGQYTVGQVSRTPAAFTAELRSKVGVLAQKRGRQVLSVCDAELGDSRCGVNLSALRVASVVGTIQGETDFLASGLGGANASTFANGILTWVSGANAGALAEVRAHRGRLVGLWRPPRFAMAQGDQFQIVPGCDKSFRTCRAKFANGDNFRGFPSIVGEAAMLYATAGEAGLDGGSRNKW